MMTTTTTKMLVTTYTQLRDGSWGLRVQGFAAPGEELRVSKKSGETKTEIVGRVIWTGNGVSLCTIASSSGSARRANGGGRSRGKWSGCSCGSLENQPRASDCWNCQHDS